MFDQLREIWEKLAEVRKDNLDRVVAVSSLTAAQLIVEAIMRHYCGGPAVERWLREHKATGR